MEAYVGLGWLMSLLLATYLGYDRGRWAAGLILGLLFGPLGVIAAGLLQPSVEVTAERTRAIQRHMAQLHRAERLAARKRRHDKAQLDDWVDAVEQQVERSEAGFAERLEELAGDLEQLSGADPARGQRLKAWANWLNERADDVRSSPRQPDRL